MSKVHGVDRINACFAQLEAHNKKAAFVTFTMAFDPDYHTSLDILCSLPDAGADIVELGMPFSDPMADGPAIQLAGERALAAGATLSGILKMVEVFREKHPSVPLILMGYYNPILHFGIEKFIEAAYEKGVDGLLIVDLPPEEDGLMFEVTQRFGVGLIKLATPTTDKDRLQVIASKASGFLYYVSVSGVTGVKSADQSSVVSAVDALRKVIDIPIVVGFGVKTVEQVSDIGDVADGVVVGSALVRSITSSLETGDMASDVLALTKDLSSGVLS